jgi:hypothetical protein
MKSKHFLTVVLLLSFCIFTPKCCLVKEITKSKTISLLKEPIVGSAQPTFEIIGITYDNFYFEEKIVYPWKQYHVYRLSKANLRQTEIDTILEINNKNVRRLRGNNNDTNSILLEKKKQIE